MGVSRKAGRPTRYTQSIADDICSRIAAGESLRAICRDARMPTDTVVQEWASGEPRDGRCPYEDGREAFAARYARAREQGYERMAEEILEISDDIYTGPDGRGDNALVQQARLRVDSRKWLLSKMLPRKYGDRLTAEIAGDPNAPLVTRIELVPVDPVPRPQKFPARDDDEVTVTTLRALPSR